MKFYSLKPLFFSILTIFTMSGCVATQTDIEGLNTSISELQRELSSLRRNQASLSSDIKNLNQTMGALNERLDENKRYISMLLNRFDDFDASVENRLKEIRQHLPTPVNPTGRDPTPTELYQLAYSDYFAGKFDLATIGFENLLRQYPSSKVSADGQYYLAECYYAKKQWQQSLDAYDKFIKTYPTNDKFLAVLYRKSLVLKTLNRLSEAKQIWDQIIIVAPDTNEGRQAKERVFELTKSTATK